MTTDLNGEMATSIGINVELANVNSTAGDANQDNPTPYNDHDQDHSNNNGNDDNNAVVTTANTTTSDGAEDRKLLPPIQTTAETYSTQTQPETPAQSSVGDEAVPLKVGGGGDKDKDKDKENDDDNKDAARDRFASEAENERETLRETMASGISTVRKFSNLECVMFFIFLIIFCVMMSLSRGMDDRAYTQTAAIRNRLTLQKFSSGYNDNFDRVFQDTNQVMEIWNYIREVMFKVMLTEGTMGLDTMEPDPELRYYPLGQARLLGGLRLRQVRRKEKSCEVGHGTFPECWSTGDDKSTFYGNNLGYFLPYEYQSESDLQDQSWRAKYNAYSGGGYVHDFPLNYSEALEQANLLQQGDWIDEATAFVAIDFNLYNPSINYHTIGRMAFEMPVGGVFPYFEIKTWKFLRYDDDYGDALAALQILWVILIVFFTGIMANEMYREGCTCKKEGYWGKRWRILDLINYCFLYGAIFVYIANEAYRAKYDWRDIDVYRSFRRLQYFFLSETYILAFNGFLSFFKLFKYFSVNRRLKFFFTMLGKAGQDLLMFILVLVIFFLGYGFCGFMAFSSDVDDFRSMLFSFSNMVRFVIGDLNYSALQLSSRTWGLVYYISWSVLMLLILTNVFIAILSEAYGETIEEMSEEDKLSLGFFGMRGAVARLQTIFKNFNIVTVKELDEDGDGQVDATELAKKTGWTEEEAQKFIDEHDTDKNGKLSQKEWEDLAQEAQEKRQQHETEKRILGMAGSRPSMLGKGGGGHLSVQQFEELQKKIDTLDELLRAQLQQTKTGTKALKEIQRRKHSRKGTRVDSMDDIIQSDKED